MYQQNKRLFFQVLILTGFYFLFCSMATAAFIKHQPLKIVLLGGPGSGKGTQGKVLSERHLIPHISTGALLRAEVGKKSREGTEIQKLMTEGKLVPDEIVVKLLSMRLGAADCKDGFILDGFPRKLSQAKALEKAGVNINKIIELRIPDEKLIDRITGRRIHTASGRTYHLVSKPPQIPGKDDITGEPLSQRADDTKETVMIRIKSYHEQTQPVIDWYQKKAEASEGKVQYITIKAGNKSIKQVTQAVSKALGK